MSIFDKFNKGQRPANAAEWQSFLNAVPRTDRDRMWPGMHRDLIPAYEMLDDLAKASAATFGTWDSAKSRHVKTDQTAQDSFPGAFNDAQPLVGTEQRPYIGIKTGENAADVSDLSEEILATYPHIEAVWAMYTNVEPVITSGRDGHADKPDSHHHTGNAIDVRAKNISDEVAEKIAATLQQRLGYDYFVDHEQPNPNNPAEDHIHIEYDPK